MLTGADQELPFQLMALLPASTAMQKVVVGQETESTPPPELSMLTSLDQELPFQLMAVPPRSTVMQKVVVGQEMDSNG